MPASPTYTVLVNFNGSDGSTSFSSLIADAAGDLFGTTQTGGAHGDGVVFELARTASGYASTPTVLYSFTGGTDGAKPISGLLADAAGDLFGTTSAGGNSSSDGTVFELARTGTGYAITPTILHTFTGGSDGAFPLAGLVSDAAGNLFGTTLIGGINGNGAVFEIAKTASGYAATATVLHDFTGGDGAGPTGTLMIDAAGDLFGTTNLGGAGGGGTVFEIAKNGGIYASAATVLYAFSNDQPNGGLVADAAGDLFGTTYQGGSHGQGTVFEIKRSGTSFASNATVLYSFTGGSDGGAPEAALLLDAAGDLFGTTYGQSNVGATYGSVFELQRTGSSYASTATVLKTFTGGASDGGQPFGALWADAAGNLFGTTTEGGTNSAGTVYEITNSGFQVACFAEGTRIATARGEVAVESLRVGDKVRTAASATRPVVWLGHRRTDCARHARPWDVMPVRVCAGAFGPGVPSRDLVLSPDHAVFVGGALIPVRYLLNGASVVQQRVDAITYWHVELDAHDVLLAEGLPCESYLDTGNRSAFANAGSVVQAHPEFARAVWAERACAPLVLAGEAVQAARSTLIARLPELGFAISDDPGLRVVVDGALVEPQRDGAWWCIALPDGARAAVLRSHAAPPSWLTPTSEDTRPLGVSVTRLRLDGATLRLDHPRLGQGWHAAERALRWTDGDGRIDVRGAAVLELRLGHAERRPVRVGASVRRCTGEAVR